MNTCCVLVVCFDLRQVCIDLSSSFLVQFLMSNCVVALFAVFVVHVFKISVWQAVEVDFAHFWWSICRLKSL